MKESKAFPDQSKNAGSSPIWRFELWLSQFPALPAFLWGGGAIAAKCGAETGKSRLVLPKATENGR
jgi:hypothetical protein